MSTPNAIRRRPFQFALPLMVCVALACTCNLLPGAQATPTPLPPAATDTPTPAAASAATPPPPEITPAAAEPTPAPAAFLAGGGGWDPLVLRLGFDAQDVLHLVFRSNKERGSGDFFHMQLAPGGNWTEPENLTQAFEYLNDGPQLLRDGEGSLCVLWTGGQAQADSSTWGLFRVCRSGDSWIGPERLSPEWDGFSAALAPDGSVQTLLFGGLTGPRFGGEVLTGEEAWRVPKLAIDAAGAYHAAWVNLGAPYRVLHRRSEDAGQTWSAPEPVSADDAEPNALELSLVADAAGRVHAAWAAYSGLYYRVWSPDGGWGQAQALGPGSDASLQTDSTGRAALAWTGGDGIMLARQDGAGAFGAPLRFGEAGSLRPALALDGQGNAHLAWVAANRDLIYFVSGEE